MTMTITTLPSDSASPNSTQSSRNPGSTSRSNGVTIANPRENGGSPSNPMAAVVHRPPRTGTNAGGNANAGANGNGNPPSNTTNNNSPNINSGGSILQRTLGGDKHGSPPPSSQPLRPSSSHSKPLVLGVAGDVTANVKGPSPQGEGAQQKQLCTANANSNSLTNTAATSGGGGQTRTSVAGNGTGFRPVPPSNPNPNNRQSQQHPTIINATNSNDTNPALPTHHRKRQSSNASSATNTSNGMPISSSTSNTTVPRPNMGDNQNAGDQQVTSPILINNNNNTTSGSNTMTTTTTGNNKVVVGRGARNGFAHDRSGGGGGVDGNNTHSSSEALSLPPLLAVDVLSNSELISMHSPNRQHPLATNSSPRNPATTSVGGGKAPISSSGGAHFSSAGGTHLGGTHAAGPQTGGSHVTNVVSSSVGGAGIISVNGMDNFGMSGTDYVVSGAGAGGTSGGGGAGGGGGGGGGNGDGPLSAPAQEFSSHPLSGDGIGVVTNTPGMNLTTNGSNSSTNTTPRPAPIPATVINSEVRDAFQRFIVRLPGKWVKPILRALVLQTLTESAPLAAITTHAIHDAYLDLMGEVLHTKHWCREDAGALTATSYAQLTSYVAPVRSQVSLTGNLSGYNPFPNGAPSSSGKFGYAGREDSMSRSSPGALVTTLDPTSIPRVNLFYLCSVCGSLLRFHSQNLRQTIVSTCRRNIDNKIKEELAAQQAMMQQQIVQGGSSPAPRRTAANLSSTEMAIAITKQLSRGITFNASLAQGVLRPASPGSRLFLPRYSSMNASTMGNESVSGFIGVEQVEERYSAVSFEVMPSIFLKFKNEQRRARHQNRDRGRTNTSTAFARLTPYFQQEFVCAFCIGHPSCSLFGATLAPEFFVGMSSFITDPMRAIVSTVKGTLHRLYNTLTGELYGVPLPRDTRARIRAPPLEISVLYIRDSNLYFAYTCGIMGKLFFSSRPDEHIIVNLDDDKSNAADMATSTTAENLGYSTASPAAVSRGNSVSGNVSVGQSGGGVTASGGGGGGGGRKRTAGAYDMPTIRACSADFTQLCADQGQINEMGGTHASRVLVSLRPGASLESLSFASASQQSMQQGGQQHSRTPSGASTTQITGLTHLTTRIVHSIVVASEEFWMVMDASMVSKCILVMQTLNELAMRVPYELRRAHSSSSNGVSAGASPSSSLGQSPAEVAGSSMNSSRKRGGNSSTAGLVAVLEKKLRDAQQFIATSDGIPKASKIRLETFFQHRVQYFTVVCPRQLQHNENTTACPHRAEYESVLAQAPGFAIQILEDENGCLVEGAEKDCYLPLSGAMSWWLAAEATALDPEDGYGCVKESGSTKGKPATKFEGNKYSVVVINICTHRHTRTNSPGMR